MKITILIESEIDRRSLYLINRLSQYWREQGDKVIYKDLTSPPEPTDLAILHSDKTILSPDLVNRHLNNSPLINGKALDISKQVVSRQLCTRNDTFSGPVIIKTNLNSWGIPEQLRDQPVSSHQKIWHYSRTIWKDKVINKLVPWQILRRLPVGNYPLLPDLQTVPDWIWESSEYVVEKFVPEKVGDHYITRYWTFLGNKEIVYTKYSTDYLVKRGEIVHSEFTSEVPAELRQRRHELGFDYGKFDWVMHEGQAILLDANRTPCFEAVTSQHPEVMKVLAEGITNFLKSGTT